MPNPVLRLSLLRLFGKVTVSALVVFAISDGMYQGHLQA